MVKVISLSNKAYATMKAMKQGDESFSDVVMKLSVPRVRKSIMDLAGTWPGSKEELDKIEKMIAADRKNFKTRNYVLS